jgi:hypothetical protein
MIQLISKGHLTQTDKTHIKALFNSGMTQAKINRTIWVIEKGTPSDNQYTISKHTKDRGLGFVGEPLRMSKYTYDIIYTP